MFEPHGDFIAKFEFLARLDLPKRVPEYAATAHFEVAERYPFNPNGSPGGITGVTTADGHCSIMMPYPECAYRSTLMSWYPAGSGEDSPWMRMFRNARHWVG